MQNICDVIKPDKNGCINGDHDSDVHEGKEILEDVRMSLLRVSRPGISFIRPIGMELILKS